MIEQINEKTSYRKLLENRHEDYPMVGDLVRVSKSNNDKDRVGLLGVVVGQVGVRTMELQVVFNPVFPVKVRDGLLTAKGEFSEYINNSNLLQYKQNSSYNPIIKTLVNFSKYSEELIVVKQLFTYIN
jgi:hypothetical protein